MLSKELQEFIEKNISLIEENNYDVKTGLYNEVFKANIVPGDLTTALLTAGIDPLEYLDYIPWRYLAFNRDFEEFHIPENITSIGTGAFYMSSIKTLYIPKSVTVFGEHCFSSSKIETIIFEGTRQDFMFISDAGASDKQITIVTKDSTFNFWGEW